MSAMVPPTIPPTAAASRLPSPADLPDLAKPAASAVFRVMFWKEVRELAPWAALAAIGFSIALTFVLYQATDQTRSYNNNNWQGFSIISTTFFLVTALVMPIMALMLGFLQFFPESKPDRFAFMVYRPSARSRLFLAKVLPGLAVYLVVTVLPLLGAVLWAKDPHHLPYPFRWDMALPALADVGAGIPYYFAGMLVARRTEARWLGSRLLPMAAPVLASAMNYAFSHFYWALLEEVVAVAILLVVARGAFLGGGQYFPQPRLAKIALGAMLGVALFTLGILALAIVDSWTTPRETTYRNTSIVFRADGTPLREVNENDRAPYLEDLQGKFVGDMPTQDWDRRERLLLSPTMLADERVWYIDREPFRFSQRYFNYAFSTGRDIFWSRPAEGDYLVGYDMRRRELIGAIGPDGFAAGRAVPPTRFRTPIITISSTLAHATVILIGSGDTLYRLGDAYRLEPMFTTPDHARIIKIGQVHSVTAEQVASPMAVATGDHVYVLSETAPEKVAAAYLHANNRGCNISVAYAMKTDEYIFEFAPIPYAPFNTTGPTVAAYVRPGDAVSRLVTLPADENKFDRQRGIMERIVPVLSPPAGIVTIAVLQRIFDAENFPRQWPELLGYLAYSAMGAAATALLVFGFSRRYLFPRSVWITWVVLGLLLGVTGLLLLWCMRPLPWRVRCSTCGRRRPVNDPLCPHCGAAFALPKATGTEIFA